MSKKAKLKKARRLIKSYAERTEYEVRRRQTAEESLAKIADAYGYDPQADENYVNRTQGLSASMGFFEQVELVCAVEWLLTRAEIRKDMAG